MKKNYTVCEYIGVDGNAVKNWLRNSQWLVPNSTTRTPIPGIQRATSLKILGVTITSKLSLSEHVGGVISSCAQSLHAIRVLRYHGMCNSALQTIYRSVIISKLLHASISDITVMVTTALLECWTTPSPSL